MLIGAGAATAPRRATAADPAQEVVDHVNRARAGAGCGPVSMDGRLNTAAQRHSADMAARDYFSHTTPEGVSFAQRIKQAGHPAPGAENIAHGYRSADQVMDGWMNSAGHRANILNCSLRAIGVGVESNGWYWTQDFGR